MAQSDEDLLSAAGLNLSEAAKVLGDRTRQAISKGIKTSKRYFTEADVARIYAAAAARDPLAKPRLKHLITASFREFADRILAADVQSNMADALKLAERAWLIVPGFTQGYLAQQEHFDHLIGLLNEVPDLELLAFSDRREDTLAFSRQCDPSWFAERRLRVMTCPLLSGMPMMLITSPKARPNCFVLLASGFAPLSPQEAARCVNGVGAALSDAVGKNIPANALADGQPFDLLTTDIEAIQT